MFLLNAFCCIAQQEIATTLVLTPTYCSSSERDYFRKDTFLLYKLPENKLVETIVPKDFVNAEIRISNIAISTYKIVYKNLFGRRVDTIVVLNKTTTNSIQLCMNKLLEYPKNTLAQLRNKDSIAIYFHSQGCFHSYSNKILVVKEKALFVAKLYNADWVYPKANEETYTYKDGRLLKTVVLSNRQIEDFIKFENELNLVGFGGCTTEDYYTIKSKYFSIDRNDGGCDWDGFRYLQKSFFGE